MSCSSALEIMKEIILTTIIAKTPILVHENKNKSSNLNLIIASQYGSRVEKRLKTELPPSEILITNTAKKMKGIREKSNWFFQNVLDFIVTIKISM